MLDSNFSCKEPHGPMGKQWEDFPEKVACDFMDFKKEQKAKKKWEIYP